MSSYTYPQMPLTAGVWFQASTLPPGPGPDELVACSLSPVRPEDFFRATVPFLGPMFASHIIRTAPDDRYCENCQFNEPTNIVPGSVFEVPWGSGHLYVAIWAHQVGAGFPNHHARIYVARWLDVPSTQPPLFKGWI